MADLPYSRAGLERHQEMTRYQRQQLQDREATEGTVHQILLSLVTGFVFGVVAVMWSDGVHRPPVDRPVPLIQSVAT